MVDDKVVDIPVKELTEEELKEIKDNTLIEIKIPLAILDAVK
jgi:hypothetical protein